ASTEEELLGDRAGEECDLAVERTRGAHSERTGAPPCTVHDAAFLNGDGRAERAAQLEQNERHLVERTAAPRALFANRERGGAQLVGGAQVHAIDLSMRGNRWQVN